MSKITSNYMLNKLSREVSDNFLTNIVPVWNRAIDVQHGGFAGQIDGNNRLNFDADKGCVLNARILWTFSAAYRIYKEQSLLNLASRAKDYITENFIDKEFGGVYWMLDKDGNPTDTKKQIYAQGFAIYGLSEYYRATGDESALSLAKQLFELIEKHSFDPDRGGYFEAFTREWSEIGDMRLSAKDANEKKTMNTHLHILEPYTNLYRVWKDPLLEKQIRGLIDTFLTRIVDSSTYHLNLFFDESWNRKHDFVSYGHDIEASWLIHEAAVELGDRVMLEKVEPIILKIADAAAEGLAANGAMKYELNRATNHLDGDYHWWVQAESVVGYTNAYEVSGRREYLDIALKCWDFISENIVDSQNGEWRWSLLADGSYNTKDDKLGIWKCPYHNSRMCFEIVERNIKGEKKSEEK